VDAIKTPFGYNLAKDSTLGIVIFEVWLNTIIIGYGNPDREDDGVAWHILAALTARLGEPVPDLYVDGFEPQGKPVDFMFRLQLMPELAETISEYDRVCFVDAHTGAVPEEVHVAELSAQFQASPFTHHMTPETCLSLSQALYGKAPQAMLVSVRGYAFGFAHTLSPRTAELADDAVNRIWQWLKLPDSSISSGNQQS
jgi:hydrogenase maturation protease